MYKNSLKGKDIFNDYFDYFDGLYVVYYIIKHDKFNILTPKLI